ncbi:adenylosuccinate synthetase [Gordonia phthalatica]|uniref:Adenylosuccinate synthetase n=1 Tax=Gordonia phthalatica TaxID=1136941 RepID=A0A0N9N0M0_9ACTN|nr:adenylosuccinate synthetase [Gordonia phthalatica]ALG84126.1 adenylosuccinate synthetase [Gordonia phthalatica]
MNGRHIAVVGLGFGDETKGATVDWLSARLRPSAVVRFNGGAQAAHNVVADGVHHTFRLFGSGTFAGVPTHLSRHVAVDPWRLAAEALDLEGLGVPDPLRRISVSPDAAVVTPIHIAANRTREDRRGDGRHGSCGLGIGESRWYRLAHEAGLRRGESLYGIEATGDADVPALTVADCLDPQAIRRKLMALSEFYAPLLEDGDHEPPSVRVMAATLAEFGRVATVVDDRARLADAADSGRLLFEGAQGVLLDEWRGLHPHTTWSTTLPSIPQQLLAEAGQPPALVLGVVRAYATRHGAGPLPTEDAALTIPEPHNGTGVYQGAWRTGHVDLPLLRYAADVCRRHGGLDALAVSHLDAIEGQDVRVARRYDGGETYRLGAYRDLAHQAALTDVARSVRPVLDAVESGRVPIELARAAGVPAAVLAAGPRREDRTPTSAGETLFGMAAFAGVGAVQ